MRRLRSLAGAFQRLRPSLRLLFANGPEDFEGHGISLLVASGEKAAAAGSGAKFPFPYAINET